MKKFNFCQNRSRLNRAISSLEYYTNEAIAESADDSDEEMLLTVALNSQLETWLVELKSYWNKNPIEGEDYLFPISEGLNKAYNIAYTTESDERAYTYLEIANWLTQLEMYRLLDSSGPELQHNIGVTLRKGVI